MNSKSVQMTSAIYDAFKTRLEASKSDLQQKAGYVKVFHKFDVLDRMFGDALLVLATQETISLNQIRSHIHVFEKEVATAFAKIDEDSAEL